MTKNGLNATAQLREIQCLILLFVTNFSTGTRCDLSMKTASHDYQAETKTTNQNVAQLVYLLCRADGHGSGDYNVPRGLLHTGTEEFRENEVHLPENPAVYVVSLGRRRCCLNECSEIQVCWKEKRNGISDEPPLWFSTESQHQIFTLSVLGFSFPKQLSPKV